MTKLTAVEWLVIQLYEKMDMSGDGRVFNKLFEQAKKMEKEQIQDAYIMGSYDMAIKEFNPEKYYKETYNK